MQAEFKRSNQSNKEYTKKETEKLEDNEDDRDRTLGLPGIQLLFLEVCKTFLSSRFMVQMQKQPPEVFF